MPSLKYSLRGRRGWTDRHRRQLATGWCPFAHEGWSADSLSLLHPAHRAFTSRQTIPDDVFADMAAAWAHFGAEIEAEYREKHAGCRPWFAWIAELLPAEPRRVVDEGHYDEDGDARVCMPSGRVWEQDGGCESSLSCLLRRDLLPPGELDRLRAKESSGPLSAAEHFERGRQHDWMHRLHPRPHDIACVGLLLGESFLTADELDAAADELAMLRSWEAGS